MPCSSSSLILPLTMSDPGTEATNRKYSELVGFDLTCLYRNLPFSSCLLKNLFVVTQRPLLRNLSILPYFGGCVTSNLKLIFQAIKEKYCTITISYEFIIRFIKVTMFNLALKKLKMTFQLSPFA